MSQKIKFAKMHGLGNDFVIIKQDNLPENCDLKQLALKMSNRHTGIGCDQFIVFAIKQNRENDNVTFENAERYEMFIYNQDGSIAKLCGNATRCLAKLIYLHSGRKDITLKVQGRELSCKVLDDNKISVDFGEVSFSRDWMPSPEKTWSILERYMIDLKEVICADVGNQHFVIFSDLNNQDKQIIGEKLQETSLFPDGVNVNFASIKNNKIYLSVWERGAGLTLACGSGACASFASAVKLGFIDSSCEVVFDLGSLYMSKNGNNIIMTGPASLVAQGEFFYE